MAEQNISVTTFSGAISQSLKVGLPGSGRFVKFLNPYLDPSYLSPFQKPTKVSGSTVVDLVKWMEDGTPYDTNRWFYDLAGNIYKETSAFSWSVDRAGATIANGAAGQGLKVFTDGLYYATSTTLGRKYPLDGTPAYNDDFLSDGTTNVDISQAIVGAAQVYTTPVAIAETAGNRFTFSNSSAFPHSPVGQQELKYDPIKAISVFIVAKGTGDWTVTVHDVNNVLVGAKTIANASLTNTALNVFTFSTPLRIDIGNEYHFHVTSTVADGTVQTGTSANLETVTFTEFFGILITDPDFHPMQIINDLLVIGNNNYVATWDTAIYNPNAIAFDHGFKVRALSKDNEYLVIACWRGDSISSVEEGRLYYWDGISPVANFFKPVTMGLPNAIYNADNKLYGIYGSFGQLFVGSEPFQNIQQVPKLAPKKTIEVYPGAMTTWQRQVFIGYGATTDDSTGVEQGVYAWGNKYDAIPESLTYAFSISTGTTQGTTLKIGMVKGVGKSLYVGWRDGASYGVDKMITTDDASASFSWESLIFDNGNPAKDKLALDLVIQFLPLASGETITPKFKINRATNFTLGDMVSTVGASQARLQINDRFGEIEFGFNGTSTGTFPQITGIYFAFDDNAQERNFRL
jgi:hypothetical protein